MLAKEVDLIRKLGVRFVFNTRVGRDLTLETLKAGNDAVLICVGAQEDQVLGIPGEGAKGVFAGYRFLEELNASKTARPGAVVIVIGGGNSAIDAARSVFRLGATVTVAYRRTKEEMPANREELEGAIEEGLGFLYMVQPTEVVLDAKGAVRAVRFMKMKSGTVDTSGRRAPVPTGETVEVPCDAVIVAVGEKVAAGDLAHGSIELEKSGAIATDRFGLRTSDSKVWAAGDATTGPATAAEAMGLAKRAARAINRALTGEDNFEVLFRTFDYINRIPEDPGKGRMNRSQRVPPSERRGNFVEIAMGYTGEQAFREAERCLRCDVREAAPARDGTKPGRGALRPVPERIGGRKE